VPVRVGLTATVEATVTDADTASALGSGEVAVLGTPRLLALAEAATVAALHGRLEPGQTSVGTRVRLDHRRPSAVGASVRVLAELVEVDGRSLRFEITAVDGSGELVGAGEVRRAVVDRGRFLAQIPVVDRG
jgi:fluoroacetyl-CoA thioesterase